MESIKKLYGLQQPERKGEIMVTITDTAYSNSGLNYTLSLVGLSTDEKPTGVIQGLKITNGSTFFEMDTQKVKFFDEENTAWL